ncbi:MAG: autotransporter outer membrane beta-barrel domain-containing protein, partial [Duodenibacillus sp.]|nr:autotransporter outer membrane beta-barrel domain-containing protein [Duodenibacillus sp.]
VGRKAFGLLPMGKHEGMHRKARLPLGHDKYGARVAQVYGEVAYTGLGAGAAGFEPYFGLAGMHLSADSAKGRFGNTRVKSRLESRTVAVTNLGVRAKVPFEAGGAAVKAVADINWTQFMGDTRGVSKLDLGNGSSAKIKSEKLGALAAVGLGVEAQLAKSATLGVSYNGAFGGKVRSHGVSAKLKIAF